MCVARVEKKTGPGLGSYGAAAGADPDSEPTGHPGAGGAQADPPAVGIA